MPCSAFRTRARLALFTIGDDMTNALTDSMYMFHPCRNSPPAVYFANSKDRVSYGKHRPLSSSGSLEVKEKSGKTQGQDAGGMCPRKCREPAGLLYASEHLIQKN